MTPLRTDALVVETGMEGPYLRVRLHAPALAVRYKPGQFVSVDLGGAIRQAVLPAASGKEGLDFLLWPDHPATALAPAQTVSLLGPLGKPIRLPQPPARLLLVADHLHLPALLPAAHQALADGCSVALLLAVPGAADLYPLANLPAALEVHVMTVDGSTGQEGSIISRRDATEPLIRWAGQILVAADPVLYPTLAELVRTVRLGPGSDFVQVLLLPTIACGVGVCQGCVVRLRRGYRRVCIEGPVFDLLEVAAT